MKKYMSNSSSSRKFWILFIVIIGLPVLFYLGIRLIIPSSMLIPSSPIVAGSSGMFMPGFSEIEPRWGWLEKRGSWAHPALIDAVRNGSTDYARRGSARLLGKQRATDAISVLGQAIQKDKNEYVSMEAARALGQIGTPQAAEELLTALNSNIYQHDTAHRMVSMSIYDSIIDALIHSQGANIDESLSIWVQNNKVSGHHISGFVLRKSLMDREGTIGGTVPLPALELVICKKLTNELISKDEYYLLKTLNQIASDTSTHTLEILLHSRPLGSPLWRDKHSYMYSDNHGLVLAALSKIKTPAANAILLNQAKLLNSAPVSRQSDRKSQLHAAILCIGYSGNVEAIPWLVSLLPLKNNFAPAQYYFQDSPRAAAWALSRIGNIPLGLIMNDGPEYIKDAHLPKIREWTTLWLDENKRGDLSAPKP